MYNFWFWFMLSVIVGIILFFCTYLYARYEHKKEKSTEVTSKKDDIISSFIMFLWPIAACLATWTGIWLNL